jgi:hypothetical protein
MTGQEIIDKFNLYVDDMSELSSSEELDLLNKIYYQVSSAKNWEWTKKEYSSTTTGVNYLALPSDFLYLVQNYNYTDRGEYGRRPVVFVDDAPFQVISWSDRKQYTDTNGYAYIDFRNSRLYFTSTPTSGLTVEYDYHAIPAALAVGTEPIFPEMYQDVIYHGMCVDSFIVQMSDKAKSYLPENKARYDDYIASMAIWNSNLVQM